MKLEFKPQPLEALQARYPKALEKIWLPEEVLPAYNPGQLPENVFDFYDQMRMVVYVEKHGPDHVIMVSASYNRKDWEPNSLYIIELYANFDLLSKAAQRPILRPVRVLKNGIPIFCVADTAHKYKHGIQRSPQLN